MPVLNPDRDDGSPLKRGFSTDIRKDRRIPPRIESGVCFGRVTGVKTTRKRFISLIEP